MAEAAQQLLSEPEPTTIKPVAENAPIPAVGRTDFRPAQPAQLPPEPPKKRSLRKPLLLLGPAVVIAGALWTYLAGGRYASTDDAYIKADIVNIANDVSGIVASVAVKEGQLVRKGEILFQLNDEPFRIALDGALAQLGVVKNQLQAAKANYNAARAQVEQAKIDLDFYKIANQRQSDLAVRGVSAQSVLDQTRRDYLGAQSHLLGVQKQADALLAQLGGKPDEPAEQNAQYLIAKAAADKARYDLADTRVFAPVDGYVTNVAALQPGNFLATAQTAFNLVSGDKVWVEAHLKETDLEHVKVGATATVTVDTYPSRTWKAHVAAIAPATGSEFSVLPAQNSSGNWVKVVQRLTVRLAVEQAPDSPRLRAGMSVYAAIDTGVKRSMATLWGDILRIFRL